ncbi:MAG: tRNA pseudouridine(13) synthase TruD, partial [Candidatus Micrarchaeota archaeon]
IFPSNIPHMQSLAYLSKKPGIGGEIKTTPEDFIVEEIMQNGMALDVGKEVKLTGDKGDFTYFVLQKKNWNTIDALRAIGDKLGCGMKSFGYAGMKDRNALTTQLASVYKQDIGAVSIKDIKILGSWKSEKKLELGDLLGNRFTIRVKSPKRKTEQKIHEIKEELGGVFPNYFGPQRFGTRENNHVIGKNMLQGSFRRACEEYLFGGKPEENESAKKARENLKSTGDYKKALVEFPGHLVYERLLLLHLSKNPNDYVNAIRKLPRGISLMFVHSYQSYLFNRALSEKIKGGGGLDIGEYNCLPNEFGFPDLATRADSGYLVGKLIGYESELGGFEKQILEEEGIRLEDFRMRSFPELSSKGWFRAMTCPLNDFSFKEDGCEFRFSLPSGSYATMVMREFLTEDKGLEPVA